MWKYKGINWQQFARLYPQPELLNVNFNVALHKYDDVFNSHALRPVEERP